MNFSSEGSQNASVSQPLIRNDANDSGVDLSEPGITNSSQSLLSTHNSQHTIIGRSHSANLGLTNGQDNQNNHSYVVKTSSSPTPEQTSSNRSSFVPLSAVLSAPAQSLHSYYSDFRHQNSSYQQQQIKPTLTISDEDDEDSSQKLMTNTQSNDNFHSDMNTMNNTSRLRQWTSLRNKNPKNPSNNNDSVSQYLGVDSNTGSVRNTFIQPNSGMRGKDNFLFFSFFKIFLIF
jgi:hypothetical protein